jgi:hypothetical protein
MKANQIFSHIVEKYFAKDDLKEKEVLHFIDELRTLWGVLANKIIVVRIDGREYQLSMSFTQLSKGLGKFFHKHKKKYIRTEFFVGSVDCTVRHDEDEDVGKCIDHLYSECDVVGIYDFEAPPFITDCGSWPFIWIDAQTGECKYFVRRIRKGKIGEKATPISLEEYDKYAEKIASLLATRRTNGKKKTTSKTKTKK